MEFFFLYRDTTLPEPFIQTYVPSMRILERGFTDTTKLRGGPGGNVRYIIVSSQGRDLTGMNENAHKWGLVVFQPNTVFAVLDVYVRDGVTQILLTTEPISVPEAIAAARKDFDTLVGQQPQPSFEPVSWRQRVAAPLGLDDNGAPFPLA